MVILIIVPGKKDQISGRLQKFKIKICCQGVLVTLVSIKHLHSATKQFRKRFRECCSGHKLGLNPRNRSGKPKLHHHLQLEALTSTSIQVWLDRFPKHSSLRSHTWMISGCFRPGSAAPFTPLWTQQIHEQSTPCEVFGVISADLRLAALKQAAQGRYKAKAGHGQAKRKETLLVFFHYWDRNFRTKTLTKDRGNCELKCCVNKLYCRKHWANLLQVLLKYSHLVPATLHTTNASLLQLMTG